MAWIRSVFDRTSEDILKVQSYAAAGYENLTPDRQSEWLAGMKGSWNFGDLNRIENNTKFLADLYGIAGMTFKTDRTYRDIADRAEIQRIIDNINKLREYFDVYESTPDTPEAPINTYKKANDLERIIYDMYYIYENQTRAFSRDDPECGAELYSGDEIGEI